MGGYRLIVFGYAVLQSRLTGGLILCVPWAISRHVPTTIDTRNILESATEILIVIKTSIGL